MKYEKETITGDYMFVPNWKLSTIISTDVDS